MRRIRLSMIVLALLAAMLLVPALGANAHAATTSSRSAVSQTAHPHQKVQPPDVIAVYCWLPHAVEIYNQGELCFENGGHLSVNIYSVTFIKDTGNDGHSETFYCNHKLLKILSYPGATWSGNCSDITDIYL